MTEQELHSIKKELQKIPNIGLSMAEDLILLGITQVCQLATKSHQALYDELCVKTNSRQDPCVLDTFEAAVHFAKTGEAINWWEFSRKRKAT